MTEPDLLESLDGVAYIVDPACRIVAYGRRHWNAFAGASGAAELAEPAQVIGCDLLGVVQGAEVREAYRALMADLLQGDRDGFAFGFRCDAPEIRREMRMAMTPVRAGDRVTGVLFQSVVLRSAMRPPLNIFRFRDLAARVGYAPDRPILTMCSYCQKVRAAAGGAPADTWISPEDYYRRGGGSDVLISHGMCAACSEAMLEE